MTSTPGRLSCEEEVQHHDTSKAATGMVPAKSHKENKNIKINTPLKLLVFQQEVQMFHWWFLHYKLPTVKYKVVMSICTMETPHTAGLSLTPDHKSVPYLGVAHHGDKEALCHRAQDKDRAAGRLKATKQAGVIGSCNTGQTTSTTCRLASETKQVLINFKPSSGSLEVLPGSVKFQNINYRKARL